MVLKTKEVKQNLMKFSFLIDFHSTFRSGKILSSSTISLFYMREMRLEVVLVIAGGWFITKGRRKQYYQYSVNSQPGNM